MLKNMERCRLIQVERNVSSDERRYKTNRILLKSSPGFSVRTFRGSVNYWRIIDLFKKTVFSKSFKKFKKPKVKRKFEIFFQMSFFFLNLFGMFLKFLWYLFTFFRFLPFLLFRALHFSKLKITRSLFLNFFYIILKNFGIASGVFLTIKQNPLVFCKKNEIFLKFP